MNGLAVDGVMYGCGNTILVVGMDMRDPPRAGRFNLSLVEPVSPF